MWARNGRWILPEMPDFHVAFKDLLHVVNLRHRTDGFTSPPKEGVLYYRPSSSSEVKNKWSYLSTPPRAFMACIVLLYRLWLLSNYSLQLNDLITDYITDSDRTRLRYQLMKYVLLLYNYHRHTVPLRFRAFKACSAWPWRCLWSLYE